MNVYAEHFANGYAQFALSFLLSAAIGFIFYVIKEAKRELKEKGNTTQTVAQAVSQKLPSLLVKREFNTLYVFGENGEFILQDPDAMHMVRELRTKYTNFNLVAEDEETLNYLHQIADEQINEKRKQLGLN